MLNKKDLRGNAALIRDVAQLLTVLADDMEATLSKKSKKAADAAPAEPVPPVKEVAAEEPAVEPEPLTYVKVRGILSGKSASGFKTQVLALIHSYGAEKLSDVDPKHYPELVAAAGRLGGDVHA